MKPAAALLFALLTATATPALAEPNPDATGFGDAQFERMMAGWKDTPARVPQLAALYEATPKKAARSAPYATSAHPEPVEGVEGSSGSTPTGSPLAHLRQTSAYGPRLHPILGIMRNHKGIDLAAAEGTPIRATADGTVRRAAHAGGYGLMVELSHGKQTETRYGHLSRLAVVPGEQVTRGQVIGYAGSTGRSTGPHLHYEVVVAGRPVDPRAYLP